MPAPRTFLGTPLAHPLELGHVQNFRMFKPLLSSNSLPARCSTESTSAVMRENSSEYISKLHIRLMLSFYWYKATIKYPTKGLSGHIDGQTLQKKNACCVSEICWSKDKSLKPHDGSFEGHSSVQRCRDLRSPAAEFEKACSAASLRVKEVTRPISQKIEGNYRKCRRPT